MCLELFIKKTQYTLPLPPSTHREIKQHTVERTLSETSSSMSSAGNSRDDRSEQDGEEDSHIDIIGGTNLKITRLEDEDRFSNNRDARSEER